MKNIKFIKINSFSLSALVVLISVLMVPTSCQKFLEPKPYGVRTLDIALNDFTAGTQATADLYRRLSSVGYFKEGLIKIDEMSDDFNSGSSSADRSLDFFEYNSSNPTIANIWSASYGIIQQANLIIERIPLVPTYAAGEQFNPAGHSYKDQFVGEALMFRAYAYFNLVRLFGAVPHHLKPITSPEGATKPVTSVEQIYTQIEQDLNQAILKLPKYYAGTGIGNERGRANISTAKLILAYVNLTLRKFAPASRLAKEVIDTGFFAKNQKYILEPTYAGLFYASNGGRDLGDESIFEAQFFTIANGGVDETANFFSFWMGPPQQTPLQSGNFHPTDNNSTQNSGIIGFRGGIVQSYSDTSEPRFKTNFKLFRQNNIFYTNKYFEPNKSAVGLGNVPIYRLADAYLIYAEAENELGAANQPQIYAYMNAIRQRANVGRADIVPFDFDLPPGLSQANLRDSIRIERRREFPAEGKRWFDLLRYEAQTPGYMKTLLFDNQKRLNFNDSKKLFPIPFGETNNNPFIKP